MEDNMRVTRSMTGTPTKSSFAAHLSKFAYTPSPPKGAARGSHVTPVRDDSDTGSPSKRRRLTPTTSAAASKANAAEPAAPPSPSKPTKKAVRKYAAPDVYAHLNVVTDHLEEDLRVLFCGINPGVTSSETGHHFAHPTNKFYHALYAGGFTPRLYSPTEDVLLPAHHSLGLTNLVDRPTSEAAELSRVELRLGVPVLLEKIRRTRPRLVCFVGKGIWDQFEMVVKRAVRRKGEGVGLREPEGMGSVRLVKIEEEDLNLQRMETSPPPCDVPTMPPVTPLRSIRKTEIISPSKGSMSPTSNFQATPSPSKTLGTPINPRSPKAKPVTSSFEWDRPQDFKVTHEEGSRVTLFWVVPSTSGLERTPRQELFAHFAHLHRWLEMLEAGQVDTDMMDEIDGELVDEVVAGILEAEAKKKGMA